MVAAFGSLAFLYQDAVEIIISLEDEGLRRGGLVEEWAVLACSDLRLPSVAPVAFGLVRFPYLQGRYLLPIWAGTLLVAGASASFGDTGAGDRAGVWEHEPALRPEFRAETRRQVIKLMKKRKAEEMI